MPVDTDAAVRSLRGGTLLTTERASAMISHVLRSEVEQYAEELRHSALLQRARSGHVSRGTVGLYLTSVQYSLRRTPSHLIRGRLLAEARGEPGLADYFRRKLEEETGHDEWAADDLVEVGKLQRKVVVCQPSAAIVALEQSVVDAIEREPFLYLAYALFAEYITVKVGPDWVAALDGYCGVPASALTVATHHIELDQHHVEEGCQDIDALVRDERLHEPLLVMLRESMRHFSAFCDELCHSAAA